MELFTLDQLQKQFEEGFEQGRKYNLRDDWSIFFKFIHECMENDYFSDEEKKQMEDVAVIIAGSY